MSGEVLAAALLGSGLSLVAALAAQSFGAYLQQRRRVRELAGVFLAHLKAVGYLADRSRERRLRGSAEGELEAMRVQTEVLAVGSELELIAPRFLRTPTRGSVNGTLAVLSAHNQAGAHEWAVVRAAFDEAVDGYSRSLARLF